MLHIQKINIKEQLEALSDLCSLYFLCKTKNNRVFTSRCISQQKTYRFDSVSEGIVYYFEELEEVYLIIT